MSNGNKINSGNGPVLVMDLLVSLIASGIAVLVVRWLVHPISGFSIYMLVWLLVSLGCSLVGFLVLGTHQVMLRYFSIRSCSRLAFAVVIKEGLLTLLLLLQIFHFVDRRTEILILGMDTLMTLAALIIARLLILAVFDRLEENMERDVKRTCIAVYGTSDKSAAMLIRLEESPNYKVEAILTREAVKDGRIINGCKVYAFQNEEELEALRVAIGFKGVLFATNEDAEAEQDGLVKMCLHRGIHMLVTPKVEETDFGGMQQHAIKEVIDNDFIPDGMSGFERGCKRILDFIASGILIIIFAIPMLACYIAIKVSDQGPAFYKQERIGRFGRPFYILKFRSMKMDAEKYGPALYSGEDDPRLTKVGAFLRAHHLDEMPQLFNVFKGDMAFIGYRPERKFYIDQIMERDPRYYYLYQIRPGVTSYATLRNGYADTVDKMIRRMEFDLYYLRHRSFLFDARILWETFVNIAFGKKF